MTGLHFGFAILRSVLRTILYTGSLLAVSYLLLSPTVELSNFTISSTDSGNAVFVLLGVLFAMGAVVVFVGGILQVGYRILLGLATAWKSRRS